MNAPQKNMTPADILAEMHATLDQARAFISEGTLNGLAIRGLAVVMLRDDSTDDDKEECVVKMHGLPSSICNGLAAAIERLDMVTSRRSMQ